MRQCSPMTPELAARCQLRQGLAHRQGKQSWSVGEREYIDRNVPLAPHSCTRTRIATIGSYGASRRSDRRPYNDVYRFVWDLGGRVLRRRGQDLELRWK